MSLPAILVVIPTTSGPLRLRSLTPRPGLPSPAAFADGDYRPLPWSADYARLAAAGGPLARLAGEDPPPHELRLSGSFDAGRSWEAPVCLAHGLAARGHPLAAEPAQAGLVLWATGAVDLDLAVLPGDYALLDKIERSRPLLAQMPDLPLAILLPEGAERMRAEAAFRALGRDGALHVLPSESVAQALAALARAPEPLPAPRRFRHFALPAATVAGIAGLAALGVRHAPLALPNPPASEDPAPVAPAIPAMPSSPPTGETPAIRLDEVRAPSGSTCRRVAFGADAPVRRPVPLQDGERFAPSRLAPELCGVALRAEGPGLRAEAGPELRAASLPPVRLPDGAQVYFLREGARQNLVYAVQAVPEAGTAGVMRGGDGARLTHTLIRDPP